VNIDTNQQGLHVIFKDYEAAVVKLLVSQKERSLSLSDLGRQDPYSSRELWEYCNKLGQDGEIRPSVSRASVINFANRMVEDGIFAYTETTGKGGHRRLYHSIYNGPQLETMIKSLVGNATERAFQGTWWK